MKCFLRNRRVAFFGREEDVLTAKQTFEYTYAFICKESGRIYRQVREEGRRGTGVVNSYALGFCSCPFAQVSCVDDHILTVRQAGNHLLLRVSAALPLDKEETAEQLIEAAAMQEAEDYCLFHTTALKLRAGEFDEKF